jgi:DNA-binding MarR family transcriptional regulator
VNYYPFNISQESVKHKIIIGLTKLTLALRSQSWQIAGSYGLTPTQGQILALFLTQAKSEMRLSEVAEAIAITPATASAAVTALVEKDLVEKRKAADDGRAIAITITPKGEQQAQQISHWTEFLLDAIDRLSLEEQEIFFHSLLKLIQLLQERQQIPVSKMCITCRFFKPNVYYNSIHPHHCSFVDTPFGNSNLQLECQDHELAQPEMIKKNYHNFDQ